MIYVDKYKNETKNEVQESETLEQEVFRALDHQVRRDILRYVGEKKNSTFTEIMKATKAPDSPTLSYHLKSLSPFIAQHNGKYQLTPIGKDAYSLLLKTSAYDKLAFFEKSKHEATVGNTLLWCAAIVSAVYLEADTLITAVILPILAAVSISMTYQLYR